MDKESTAATTERNTIATPVVSDLRDEIIESAKTCPSCNYTSDSEFLACPGCGLIIKKYYVVKSRRTNAAPLLASSEVDADAGSCPVVRRSFCSSRKAVWAVCSVVVLFLAGLYFQISTHSTLAGPSTNDSLHQTKPSLPPVATPDNPGTSAPVTSPPDVRELDPSANSSADIPITLPNSRGITIKKVVFSSDMDASGMPVNNLTRVPFNGKKIVVRLKMEIPPEKTYQFTGKFFDGDGKLVMNVTSASIPTVSVWHAWYYHNLDRADDKPGVWKFVFLVDGEEVLEKPIEVVEQ